MDNNQIKIKTREDALDLSTKIMKSPRSSWIVKGSRKKDNENIELPRTLAMEMAQKALQFFILMEQVPYDPFCDCKQIEELLLKVIAALPDGDLAEMMEQITLNYCPVCGEKYEDS